MQVIIASVGRMKEKPYRMMADEYLKRLSRYGSYEETEIPDLPEPAMTSAAIEESIKDREGEELLRRIKPGDHVIAMAIEGKMMDSPALAAKVEDMKNRSIQRVVFVIGGSLGLGKKVLERANEKMSMSPMTFPHQLARVMLLEQLYRAAKISAGERYHK